MIIDNRGEGIYVCTHAIRNMAGKRSHDHTDKSELNLRQSDSRLVSHCNVYTVATQHSSGAMVKKFE